MYQHQYISTPVHINNSTYQHQYTSTPVYINTSTYQHLCLTTPVHINNCTYQHQYTSTPLYISISTYQHQYILTSISHTSLIYCEGILFSIYLQIPPSPKNSNINSTQTVNSILCLLDHASL